MPTGKVLRFDPDKGYGFIASDSGGQDVFLHVSDLARGTDPQAIRTGARVSFEEEDAGRGPKAANVRLDGAAPLPAGKITVDQAASIWTDASQAGYEAFLMVLQDKGLLQLAVSGA